MADNLPKTILIHEAISGGLMKIGFQHGTTAERTTLGATLTTSDRIVFYDDDNSTPYFWSGTEWT